MSRAWLPKLGLGVLRGGSDVIGVGVVWFWGTSWAGPIEGGM